MDYPKIRPVETIPVEIDNRRLICLRDPSGYASESLLLHPAALFIVSLFDGQHSILDIQEAFVRQFGELLPSETVREFITQLDTHYYLEGDRFASLERQVREQFQIAPTRALAHAGTCYHADAEQFREQLGAFFTDQAGPGLPRGRQPGPPVRAIIAPHIDLRVGGPCYAWAYREVAERSDADVFVLLGTSHAGGSHPFIVTTKDFETPLGLVRTDARFIALLQDAYGGELLRDEILHRHEHSVEFQVLFLQYVLGSERPFTIVPILVAPFHHMIARGQPPIEDPAIGDFITALRKAMAAESRSVCLVAGVDFAHVGHKFGDREGLDPSFLAWVESEDRALISPLEQADSMGFFREIAKNHDQRRICGFSPMYTLVAALDGVQGRLLRYDRSDEAQTQSAVSFASLVFD